MKPRVFHNGRDISAKSNKRGGWFVFTAPLIVLSHAAEMCQLCPLSGCLGKGVEGGGWRFCYFEQCYLCPRRVAVPPSSVLSRGALYLSSPQISACACKRDADLLLTPAISSTLLRNALFFLSFFLSFLPPPLLS